MFLPCPGCDRQINTTLEVCPTCGTDLGGGTVLGDPPVAAGDTEQGQISDVGHRAPDGTSTSSSSAQPHAAQKSRATLALWLGILGIWPVVFLGPIAWFFSRAQLADIDAGTRPTEHRARAVWGQRLGVVGTALWLGIGIVVITNTVPGTSDMPAAFDELGISFSYPADWAEDKSFVVPEPALAFSVTPDRSTGNWMEIIYLPAELGVTEEIFLTVTLPDLESRGFSLTDPREIEAAGVNGLHVSLSGITGNLTGRPHNAELVFLFGDHATYRLQAQYDDENEATVLDAWEEMLKSLVLPESS